ncbi:unnamed protein product [Malus baccata var. baccata]
MAPVLQLSLLYVAAVAFMFQHCCDEKLMMEYIGATGIPITFDYSSGKQRNGIFSLYWQSTLTPQSVAAINLSGWSLGDKVLHWYNPINPKKWVSNAVSSLGSIITTYHLDGIDIDYENFPNPKRSNSLSSFAFCIGELITGLKNKGLISVASIAPFYSTTAPYVQLFDGYAHVIDYVNHQFYTDKVTTTKGYLHGFKLRAAQFRKEKFLPAYEVDGRGIQGDAFLDALTLLQTNGFEINGVLIFSADAASENNFYYERKSQAFLLNSSSSTN